MSKKFNWGILGPGKIAHKFAIGLESLPQANLYAIGSRSQERADAFAKQYKAKKAYGSYESLVNDPEIDVIYIASPHSEHAAHTRLCLEHNKPVLCEKAFALNSTEVQKMIAMAKEKQVFLMEALWTRFLPHIEKVKALLDQDIIGKITMVKTDFGFKGNTDPLWRLFNPKLGGGSLLDIGIYPLFLMKHLFGNPTSIKASANLTENNIDKSMAAVLTYEKGSFMANIFSTIEAETDTDAIIYGTKGKIHIKKRFFTPTDIVVYNEEEEHQLIKVPYTGNGYNYEAEEVMHCLENGKLESEKLPLQFSLELMQLMDEIRKQCGIVYPVDKIH